MLSLICIMQGVVMTYRELDQRANQLAHRLVALGVGPEAPVGVMMERSLDLIVALLGVLKAGGAYVPMDPSYPPDRLALMMEDSEVHREPCSGCFCLHLLSVTQLGWTRCSVAAGTSAVDHGEGACAGGGTHKGRSAAGEQNCVMTFAAGFDQCMLERGHVSSCLCLVRQQLDGRPHLLHCCFADGL